jgi:hypothetical protein
MPWPFSTTTKDPEPTSPRLPSQEDTLIQPPNSWEAPEEPTATFPGPDVPAEGVVLGQGVLHESVSALEPQPQAQVENLDTWLERMKEAQRALTQPEPEPVPEVPPTPATVVLDERQLWSEVDQAMRDGDGTRLRELVGATEQDPLEEATAWSDPVAEAPTENSVSAYLAEPTPEPELWREVEAGLRARIDVLKTRLEKLEVRVNFLEDDAADAEDEVEEAEENPILRTQILERFEALHEKLELLPNNPFKAMALGSWIQALQFTTSALDHDIVNHGLTSKS